MSERRVLIAKENTSATGRSEKINLILFFCPINMPFTLRMKVVEYSVGPKLWTKYCFMKQNCQLQSGIAQYENTATPVSSKAIHATQ